MTAELSLCAVMRRLQVQGLGTRLVNRFKSEMVLRGVRRVLTTADNYAIGFWTQQGFSADVTLPKPLWQSNRVTHGFPTGHADATLSGRYSSSCWPGRQPRPWMSWRPLPQPSLG